MTLTEKLQPNRVWSFGVHAEAPDFALDRPLGKPVFVLDAKSLRTRRRHVHTYADPFLFVDNDQLYIFYERQRAGEPGTIHAAKTSDLVEFTDLGEILRQPDHLSYPFVFRASGGVYLLPESSAVGKTALYKFDDFPTGLRKVRTLLTGPYVDASAIVHESLWYLFAKGTRGLELFITDDIAGGELRPHPANPVTADPRYARCGGGPVEIDGTLYRIAQDTSRGYGRNINIMRINELSETSYAEELAVADYLDRRESWNSKGGHHLSITDFRDKRIVATDGLQNDFYINKLLSLLS